MSVRPNAGAIEEFDYVRFGGPTQTIETPIQVGIAIQEWVPADPDRIMLMITNNGPNIIRWSTKGVFTTATSQQLGPNNTLVLQVQDDGALTGAKLYAFADVAATDTVLLSVKRAHRLR